MTILIRKARIIDANSPHHESVKDLLLANGKVKSISSQITSGADQVIEGENLHLSPGWVDIFSQFGDPGYEFKETLETGARAAAAGGYTNVFVIPNTQPPISGKSQVEYIIEKSKGLPVWIHPIGAISRNLEGKELAEMFDMKNSMAIAFSDGLRSVQSSGLLIKALQYANAFEGVIIQVPDDRTIAPGGLMNEGIVSTRLGLPGKPSMAEELMVARDIKLTRYAESRLHFTGISTSKSLEYIRRAREGGIQITCSITPFHLYFSDEDLTSYDTNLKVNPPLRTREDMAALYKGILEGWVDCIASHHQPHEWDSKNCEFEYAKPGMIGLETTFGVLGGIGLPIPKIIELISTNPRKIFGLPDSTIEEGTTADFTIFQPGQKYRFEASHIKSKSKNSPFIGKELTGKVFGIITKDKVYLNQPL